MGFVKTQNRSDPRNLKDVICNSERTITKFEVKLRKKRIRKAKCRSNLNQGSPAPRN
jgi:hypothetical protein